MPARHELGAEIVPVRTRHLFEVGSIDFEEFDGSGLLQPVRLREFQTMPDRNNTNGHFKPVFIITKQNLYFLGASSGPDWEDPQQTLASFDAALPAWHHLFANSIGGRKNVLWRLRNSYESYKECTSVDERAQKEAAFEENFSEHLATVQPVLEQMDRVLQLQQLNAPKLSEIQLFFKAII